MTNKKPIKSPEKNLNTLSEMVHDIQDNLNTLSEMVYNIQDNLKGSDSLNSLTNKISNQQINLQKHQEELQKHQKSTNSAFKQLSELKNSIFTIMALFFGMFAFISINLNFTKGIFSYDASPVVDGYLLIVCFIITQFFFFIFIYYFILKPFFNKINNKDTKNIKNKPITITSILMFVLIISYLLYDNHNLKKEQLKLQQDIQNLVIK